MSSIFVQIASYRDLELLPTVRDCLNKSSKKHKITFGIVWQKDETETLGEFENHPDVRIISVPWNESKGLGWARSLTQSLYQDEDYTLQLDSHHRFSPNWDTTLIEMYKQVKVYSPKPLLTAYAAGYDPANDSKLDNNPCKVLPHDFKESGTIWFNPVSIPNAHLLKEPIKARLVSGHYFFTSGRHCKEYIYDPDLYFAGDEIALSVRSFTLGYDLYHPHKCVVWHHYGRNDRIKHWGDHGDNAKKEGKIEKTWGERDILSKKRIRQMLGEEDNGIDLGIYGLGDKRSIDEYEKYAGIDFKKRRVSKVAIDGVDPPVGFTDWDSLFKKTTPIRLKDWPAQKYLSMIDNITSLEVMFFNLQKKMIYRDSIKQGRLLSMLTDPFSIDIVSDYYPMKLIFRAVKDDKILDSWERDLKLNIHWS
jgi:hypothetical protein